MVPSRIAGKGFRCASHFMPFPRSAMEKRATPSVAVTPGFAAGFASHPGIAAQCSTVSNSIGSSACASNVPANRLTIRTVAYPLIGALLRP